jgi:hypothetical protein
LKQAQNNHHPMLIFFFVNSNFGFDEFVVFINEIYFPDCAKHFRRYDIHITEGNRSEKILCERAKMFKKF